MCLAIPAQITQMKEGNLAEVSILGCTRDIALDLTPAAQVGDYVLVHAGFAIEVVDAQYAQETIDLIKDFPELVGDEMVAAASPVTAPVASAASAASESSAAALAAELLG